MDKVVVDESSGRSIANEDAGAESGDECSSYGGGSSHASPASSPFREARLPLQSSNPAILRCLAHDVPDEPIPAARNRLDEIRIHAKGHTDLPDRKVDVLVVTDHGLGPQGLPDLITRD